MADNDDTPEQAVESIRKALIHAEEAHPNSLAIDILHRRLERGLRNHGHLLGFDGEQVELLAGGGTPKTRP